MNKEISGITSMLLFSIETDYRLVHIGRNFSYYDF